MINTNKSQNVSLLLVSKRFLWWISGLVIIRDVFILLVINKAFYVVIWKDHKTFILKFLIISIRLKIIPLVFNMKWIILKIHSIIFWNLFSLMNKCGSIRHRYIYNCTSSFPYLFMIGIPTLILESIRYIIARQM